MEKIGMVLPDFVLRDQHNEGFSLSEQGTGRRLLLSFHPLAWTSVCTRHMQALEASFDALGELNTLPVGISVDAWPTKHAWSKEIGIRQLRLLCDFWPHGHLATSLGLFRQRDGFSERANLLLDEKRKVVFQKVYPVEEVPDLEEVIEAIRGLRRDG